MRKHLNLRANIALGLIIAFFANSTGPIPLAHAQEIFLPAPGMMVHLSPEFTPAFLKGIAIHPENAFKFDFIIDKGDQNFTDSQKKEEYTKLIKYFLASLATPDEDQWVNLSPYEKDRIIKDDFAKTEMGRDLLAQDYLLKQITASLIYPQDKLGQKFWNEIFTRAYRKYGTTNIPVNTFNKVWIMPDNADIYEKGNIAYLYKSHLKVMLEEDYLALTKHQGKPAASTLVSNIVREIVLPQIEKEVNEDKNFASLRQVFSAMILAAWYKRVLRESLLAKIYADKSKLKGVDQDPQNNEAIYQQYLKAYKKGVFNYIQEDVDKYTNEMIPRKYFSGGAALLSEDAPLDPTTGLRVFKALREHSATDQNAAMGVVVSIRRNRDEFVAVSLDPNQPNQARGTRIFKVEPFKVITREEMLQAKGPYNDQTLAQTIEILKRSGVIKGQVGKYIGKYFKNGQDIDQLNRDLNTDREIAVKGKVPFWDAISIVLFDQQGDPRNGREISQYVKLIDDALPDAAMAEDTHAQASQPGGKITFKEYVRIREHWTAIKYEQVTGAAGFSDLVQAAIAAKAAYGQLSQEDQWLANHTGLIEVEVPTFDRAKTDTGTSMSKGFIDSSESSDEAMTSQGFVDLRRELTELDAMDISDFLTDERDLLGAQAIDDIDGSLREYGISTVGDFRMWSVPELKQMWVPVTFRARWDEYIDLLEEALAKHGSSLNDSDYSPGFQDTADLPSGAGAAVATSQAKTVEKIGQSPEVSRRLSYFERMEIIDFFRLERHLLGSETEYNILRKTLLIYKIDRVGKLTILTEANLKALKIPGTDLVLGDLNNLEGLKEALAKYGLDLSRDAPILDKLGIPVLDKAVETSPIVFLFGNKLAYTKISNLLLGNGIDTQEKLAGMSEDDLRSLRDHKTRQGLGNPSIRHLKQALARNGLYLRGDGPLPDQVVETTSIVLFLEKERDLIGSWALTRIRNILIRNGIDTVGKLAGMSEIELGNLSDTVTSQKLGKGSVEYLKQALARSGFHLREDGAIPEETPEIVLFLDKARDLFGSKVAYSRIRHMLIGNGIDTVEKLVGMTELELRNLMVPFTDQRLGEVSIGYLKEALAREGLKLKEIDHPVEQFSPNPAGTYDDSVGGALTYIEDLLGRNDHNLLNNVTLRRQKLKILQAIAASPLSEVEPLKKRVRTLAWLKDPDYYSTAFSRLRYDSPSLNRMINDRGGQLLKDWPQEERDIFLNKLDNLLENFGESYHSPADRIEELLELAPFIVMGWDSLTFYKKGNWPHKADEFVSRLIWASEIYRGKDILIFRACLILRFPQYFGQSMTQKPGAVSNDQNKAMVSGGPYRIMAQQFLRSLGGQKFVLSADSQKIATNILKRKLLWWLYQKGIADAQGRSVKIFEFLKISPAKDQGGIGLYRVKVAAARGSFFKFSTTTKWILALTVLVSVAKNSYLVGVKQIDSNGSSNGRLGISPENMRGLQPTFLTVDDSGYLMGKGALTL